MKVCTKCGIEKKLDLFYNNKKGSYGKLPSCKVCFDIVKRSWLSRNKNEFMDYQKSYRQDNKVAILKCAHNYRKKNMGKYISYYKKMNALSVKNCTDSYIISAIQDKTTLSRSEIKKYPDIIETERELLKLKRAIKNGKKQR